MGMRAHATPAVVAAILAIAIAATPGSAEDVSVTAKIEPDVAQVGGEVTLTVTVMGKFRRSASPELPPLDDFEIYESGSSQNFSFVNGQVSSSITFTYVLVPKKEGDFTIDPIAFTIGDKRYETSPLTLEVVAAGNAVPPPSPTDSSSQGSTADTPDKDQSIFIASSVDRDTVYVNQQITWTLGYYTDGRVQLLRSPNYTPPTAEGFWVEDLPPQNKYYAELHGRRYLVNEIKRAYFPTGPGTYTIGAAQVDVLIDDLRRNTIDSFFRRQRGFGQQHSLRTEEQEIVVLPLPAGGRPANFAGIVAEDLKVSMSVDKQVVQVGEPVNVSIEVNGRGNIKTIAPPSLEHLDGFKIYESGSSSDTFKRDYVVTGRKKYEFVLVPQNEGQQTIPPIRLSYFDPVAGAYRTTTSHAVNLDVRPGTKEEGRQVIYAGGDDFEVINRDIRFIHPVPASLGGGGLAAFFGSRAYLALHALPLLALFASVLVERRRRRLQRDVGFARASRALREAGRRLDAGERRGRAGDADAAMAALADALAGYFADKTNASRAGLTVEAVEAYLHENGVDAEEVSQVRKLFAVCDAARFAGGAADESALETIASARSVLRRLERRHLS